MLTSLSLAAGCVDAVGYLGLGQVFVANMTGNYVLLGLAIGQTDGLDVLQSGAALAAFVLGVAVGAAIVGVGAASVGAARPRPSRRRALRRVDRQSRGSRTVPPSPPPARILTRSG